MKYLMKLENKYKKYYWKIRVEEPYFSISINKLNLSKEQKDYLLNNDVIKKEKYIYISDEYSCSWNKDNSYSWVHTDKEAGNKIK